MVGLRWAFQSGCWKPSAIEWTSMMAAIQSEERDRISRFVFQRDAKSALVGRILMRKAVSHITGIPYRDICLGRTDKGKPFLTNALPPGFNFDFNISHDGDYAVLAAETGHSVGVDTVQLGRTPGSKSVDHFFQIMCRQLTPLEWKHVRTAVDEQSQLAAFYRYWCLKESYVKALGIGVGLSLDRLTCCVTSPLISVRIVDDTKILVDGQIDFNTRFEESLLDDGHAVSVALKQEPSAVSTERCDSRAFTVLTIGGLLDGIQPLVDPVNDDWTAFCSKLEKPQRLVNA